MDSAGATFDRSRRYRYRLWRRWSEAPLAGFVMLNPSTADERTNDPTIRRCIGFAQAWGCGGLEVVNLFALRTPSPTILLDSRAPIGPANDRYILDAARSCERLVLAWGVHGAAGGRDQEVLALLNHRELHCLKITRGGHPGHPLYLPGSARPVRFTPPAECDLSRAANRRKPLRRPRFSSPRSAHSVAPSGQAR